MSPPATLLIWFKLRSPELAHDFERLMKEDRDSPLVAGHGLGLATHAAGGRARTVRRSSRLRADRRDSRSGSLRATGERTCPTLDGRLGASRFEPGDARPASRPLKSAVGGGRSDPPSV